MLATGLLTPTGTNAQQTEDAGQAESTAPDADPYSATATIDVTPVLGAGVAADKLPANVQVVGRRKLGRPSRLGLDDTLQQELGSVQVNAVQNNPLQPDVSFRGFSASPLLGTPQGLAIYQNGTRINEPFGDVVQWDTIPELSIAEAQLIPGPNPAYGLNSLGGSLALRMKDGYGFRGLRLGALGGSFGRLRASAEYGQRYDDFALYEAIDSFREDGFRDHSHSQGHRLYADLRRRRDDHELALNLTLAATSLRGNGPAPVQQLERDRGAVFTYPDITDNGLVLLASQANVELSPTLSLQSNVYVRLLGRATLNGDEAELAPCPDGSGLCELDDDDEEDGGGGGPDDPPEPVLDVRGNPVPAAAGGDAAINRTSTGSRSYGASLQLTLRRDLDGRDNQLSVGSSLDAASVDFHQSSEVGRLRQDRAVDGSGIFLADGASRTELDTQNRHLGFYLTDTLSLTPRLHLTVAARLNLTKITLRDRLGSALDGEHGYRRLNPAAGLAYVLGGPLSNVLYASYSEGSRTPSAAELACADPDEPCRVPNAFLADPPLHQVVNRSVELGLRGRGRIGDQRLRASLAGFASRNYDDILFVAGSRIGTGYFRNAGITQRLGFEAAASLRSGPLEVSAAYQLLAASFETRLGLPGDNHPDARIDDEGRAVIDVAPGDRLPGLPAHNLKLMAGVEPITGLTASIDARLASGQYHRGDEANLLPEVPGYLVVNADLGYRLLPELGLRLRAENLFNTEYQTFGILGDGQEVLDYADDPRFQGPAPPFGLWAGVELWL
ncbi:MAG: TonB-dependent receptor [Myxococcales bacterium]|nr:TonB-dependent receptor [Myxococcales bacterium]